MHIFIEVGLILAIATLVSLVMRLLKQPLIVGYILTGIVVGPYFLGILNSTEYIELFSKLGIAILLFVVGLSLKPDVIREVGKVSLVTGLGQVVFTSLLGFGIMRLLGFGITASLYSAIALTFSSTIIILKLLSDKGDLGKLYGKISIGFLLVQDIVATVILLLVSFFGSPKAATPESALLTFGAGVMFFGALYIVSRFVLPGLSTFLAKSQEALFLFSITWSLGIAAIFYNFGFSLEIGALIAGVTLSVSPYSQEISSRMKPLRDFFILLFFVLLGSQIVIGGLATILVPAIILSLFVLIGNPIIVIILMNLLGYRSRVGFMSGLTVAQISEFSLILMALGFSFGHLSQEVVSLVTLVGIVTISGSTYLILYADKIYPHIKPFLKFLEWRNVSEEKKTEEEEIFNMIIFGYDRVGYDFVNTAKRINNKHLVVDFNPSSIQKLKDRGVPYRFGDADDVNFLEEIGLLKAEIVISTIPDFKTNLNLVSYYHNHRPDGVIVVLSHDIKDAKALYAHGASFVVMPHYLGATYASKMIEAHGTAGSGFEKEKAQHLEYLEQREKLTG
ncbi:MAG: cation:proton antiporter [bacterium]|nr:cation:proton antiporter [bacterium]